MSQLNEQLTWQLNNFGSLENWLPERSLSPWSCGLFARWLSLFQPLGKLAVVKIATAIAKHTLDGILDDPGERAFRDALSASEQWCNQQTEDLRVLARQLSEDCQTSMLSRDLDSQFDIRECGMAIGWTAGANIAFPPDSAIQMGAEMWDEHVDDCAFEGAAFIAEIFHRNSANVDEQESLMNIIELLVAENVG